jgi:hypothetical protein
MNSNIEVKKAIENWLISIPIPFDWSRSANPPGEMLHFLKPRLRILITDAAIEDNPPQEILSSLIDNYAASQEDNRLLKIKSDLEVVIT